MDRFYFTKSLLEEKEIDKLNFLIQKAENTSDLFFSFLSYTIIVDYLCTLLLEKSPHNIETNTMEKTLGQKIGLLESLKDSHFNEAIEYLKPFNEKRCLVIHRLFTEDLELGKLEIELKEYIVSAKEIIKFTEYFFEYVIKFYYYD